MEAVGLPRFCPCTFRELAGRQQRSSFLHQNAGFIAWPLHHPAEHVHNEIHKVYHKMALRSRPAYVSNHPFVGRLRKGRSSQQIAASQASSAVTAQSAADLKDDLLSEVAGLERGVRKSPEKLARIMELLNELDARDCCPRISATEITGDWKLVWTTEKETLFILQRAGLFGTSAGDVWQVVLASPSCATSCGLHLGGSTIKGLERILLHTPAKGGSAARVCV